MIPRPLNDPPMLSLGPSAYTRSIQQAEVCPRRVSAKEHRLGHYYHVQNRSSLACIMDIVRPKDLYKLIGRWELA